MGGRKDLSHSLRSVRDKLKNMSKNKEESQIKMEVVQTAIDQIRQKYGDSAIMKFGEAKAMQVPAVSTGSVSLDIALGVGGLPRGRITEIFGPEASGKTTLAQHVIAEVQKEGGIAAFIDAEHALDSDYAKKIGVDIDNMLISQPDTGEQALEILETLVRSNAVDVVVIDSVAALVPQKEIDGDMGDQHMGLQARLMSQALRKLTGVVSKSKTIVIFINQIRHKIGVFFGSPETTSGGNALKFYCSVRIEVRRSAQIKQGDKIIGNRVKVKIVKNKVAPPFRRVELDLLFEEGISRDLDLLDAALLCNVIEKSGSWLSFGEHKIAQGREQALVYLKKEADIAQEIRKNVLEKINDVR